MTRQAAASSVGVLTREFVELSRGSEAMATAAVEEDEAAGSDGCSSTTPSKGKLYPDLITGEEVDESPSGSSATKGVLARFAEWKFVLFTMTSEGDLEGREDGCVLVDDEKADRTVGIVVVETTRRSRTSSCARESGGSEFGVSGVPLERVRSTIRRGFGSEPVLLAKLLLGAVKSMTSRTSLFI